MIIKEKLETKIQRTQKKFLELSLHIQRLNREHQIILEEMDLTEEQLMEYAENPNNFSPQVWEKLQQDKKEIEERLEFQLKNIPDPAKTENSYSQRGAVQQHWLFVR